MFFKIGTFTNSAIFTGEICVGLSLIKLQVWRSATFLKIDTNPGVSCGYCKLFKNRFLIQHLRCLLLTVLPMYSKVSWGVCSLILPPCAFSFDQKPLRNVAQIILYYHVTKQYLPCLNELIGHVHSISEYVLEKH